MNTPLAMEPGTGAAVLSLNAPLGAPWPESYVELPVPLLPFGASREARQDGKVVPFQYLEPLPDGGSRIMLRLGFPEGRDRALAFGKPESSAAPAPRRGSPLLAVGPLRDGGMELRIGERRFPWRVLSLPKDFSCRIEETASGPLFDEWRLSGASNQAHLSIRFRHYKAERLVEIDESFQLEEHVRWELDLGARADFTTLLGHGTFEFEGDGGPRVEDLAALATEGALLASLQMPPIGDYVLARRQGWIGLADARNRERGMVGIVGHRGDEWRFAVENMPGLAVEGERFLFRAPLFRGRRRWLLALLPYETESRPGRRYVFHALQADWNQCRLQDHLNLSPGAPRGGWKGFFADGDLDLARRNISGMPSLLDYARSVEAKSSRLHGDHPLWALRLRVLLDRAPADLERLKSLTLARLEKWLRQFQGWREGKGDYAKNVIGFSRRLRGALIDIEILDRLGALSPSESARMAEWVRFCCLRIADEGRWPHSRTHLHPHHPDSTRDFYTYAGEPKPDRLVWTNSLPNFQSDPLCALLHAASIHPEGDEARAWRELAISHLEDQLDAYVGASGAWEESICYALYTMIYFIVTFRVVKHCLGVDYFRDERLLRFIGWLARFAGPKDLRFGVHSFPGIGNAVVPSGGAEVFLSYAGELPADHPARPLLLAAHARMSDHLSSIGEYGVVLMAVSPAAGEPAPSFPPLESEVMDDLGVALRHRHGAEDESYLFQKVGFFKDHYEEDETAINWIAKGAPLVMEYGTYSPDSGKAKVHNVLEIPEADFIRRGYLARRFFSPHVDFTACEVPVLQKHLYGRPMPFPELDAQVRQPSDVFGDGIPCGPTAWKTRKLLFVKPDYIVVFDEAVGATEHRLNWHVTAEDLSVDGRSIRAGGRFGIDLEGHIRHPRAYDVETGSFHPHPDRFGPGPENPHWQKRLHLYGKGDASYLTLLFAREARQKVSIREVGRYGMVVETADYTDYVFLWNRWGIEEDLDCRFVGMSGWVRIARNGVVSAAIVEGEEIEAKGYRFEGRGPWYCADAARGEFIVEGAPRSVRFRREGA